MTPSLPARALGLLSRMRRLPTVLLASLRGRGRYAPAHGPFHTRTRAARAALGTGLLATLAAMVGLAAAVETVKPEWRDPEFGHRLIRLQQSERDFPGRPLVLVLGTSRTQNAIHPAAMGFLDELGSPRAFNFGQSGASALKVLLTLLRILDAGIRPAVVIVEVMPQWLAGDGSAEEQLGDKVERLSLADLRRLAPYCANAGSLRDRWLAARVAPWHSQRMLLMSHWLPRWYPWQSRVDFQWDSLEPDGFFPFPHLEPTPTVRAAATAHAHHEYEGAFGGYQPGKASLRAVRELVARCRMEGIPVAFFVPPTSPTFRSWFDSRAWATGLSHVHALAEELEVAVLPAPDHLTDSDFVDGHHVLRAAADRYSRWLADVHLRPWLASRGFAARPEK